MKRSVSPESPGSYKAMNRIKRQPVDVEPPLLSTSRQTIRDIASKFLAPQNDFQYEPIGIEQIRLLYIHPGYRADTIICDLKPVAITDLDNHPYEALSYCWGVGEANKEIYIKAPEPQVTAQSRRPPQMHRIIRTVMSQKKFFVTENLEMALRRLRDENRTLTFWVDAVCIDQKNEIEKSQQVARLSEIFHQAVAVRVWLGENDDYSIEARRFIRKILNLKVLEDAVESPRAEPGSWFNLAQLMRRDWFTRRWVVQELALAREAILHIGDKQIHWDDFAEAVALFAQEAGRIAKLFGNSQEFLLNPRYLGDVRASGAFSIVHITNNLLRWVGDSHVERLIRLENLVAELLIFEARDPRDTIFAMLSIAKDIPRSLSITTPPTQNPTYNIPGTNPSLNADYSQNTLEVFKNFVAFCTLSGSLDIICRHWAPNHLPVRLRPQDYVRRQHDPDFFPTPQVIELPSWIPLVVDSAFGPPTEAVSGSRRAADDLVGEPGRPTYDAAKGTKATVWFGEVEASGENAFDPADNILYQTCIPKWTRENFKETAETTIQSGRSRRSDGCLYTLGFVIDQIGSLSYRLPLAMISKEALQMTGWTSEMEHDSNPGTEIWRTFVADRDKEGHNPPLWYRRALLTCIAHRNANGDVHISNMTSHMNSLTMREFLGRLEAVLWDRSVFKFKRQDVHYGFGLAPRDAEINDFICILLGCSVPVVLRRCGEGESAHYKLIGETYVHGMMNGEALSEYEGWTDEQVREKATLFRLR